MPSLDAADVLQMDLRGAMGESAGSLSDIRLRIAGRGRIASGGAPHRIAAV